MLHSRGVPLRRLKVWWFCRRADLLVASHSNHCTTVYGEAATLGLRVFRVHVTVVKTTELQAYTPCMV